MASIDVICTLNIKVDLRKYLTSDVERIQLLQWTPLDCHKHKYSHILQTVQNIKRNYTVIVLYEM